jgi:hypothetical protein
VTIPDEGSNASEDRMISVLEDHGDDPVVAELTGFIGAHGRPRRLGVDCRGDGIDE